MPTILDTILETKRQEVAAANARPLPQPHPDMPRGFAKALTNKVTSGQAAVIAEVKKASPSKGLIRPDFDVATIARQYTEGGAACLSVLTDVEYFQGSAENLRIARATTDLPLLRKDFVIDLVQVAEARAWGADAVLLIVAALEDGQMLELAQAIAAAGMDALVEVHDAHELERALALPADLAPMIGINNRNLKTFETSLQTTIDLVQRLPEDRVVITESGIHTPDDVALMLQHDVHAFLVGESLMRQPDPAAALRALVAPA